MRTMQFTINNEQYAAQIDPSMRLIDVLREEFNLTGTKEGCGEGECGACTVIIDGEAVNACLVLAGQAEGTHITTIEGMKKDNHLSRLQQAFVEVGAVQCGFCTPGMIMSAKALLDKNPTPTVEQIKTAISGNLCRCTGYAKIVQAIALASGREAIT